VPFCKKKIGIELTESDESELILKDFSERSEKLALPGFIETEYEKYCIRSGLFYMGSFAGLGRIPRKLNELMHGIITRRIYSLKKLNLVQNMIECEAHRELVLRYLRVIRKR
jgi:poly-gamma-glutamate synthesis protein (capsule biosynthesis protein)